MAVADLPLADSAKLDVAALPPPPLRHVATGAYVAPATPTEATAADVWAMVLGVERVGRNDDPPLNGDLHIAQSDIHALIRDQLTLLRGEVEAALEAGVEDRSTRIHLQDVLVRIDRTL